MFKEINTGMNKDLVINGQSYELVKTRVHAPVSVFKGKDVFGRVGPEKILAPEITFHKKLLRYGFPVSDIIEEGVVGDQAYYLETSLGDELMGDKFWKDTKKDACISESHFNEFLDITKRFAEAQLNSATKNKDEEGFYIGVHTDILQEELPDLSTEILKAFDKAKQATACLPYVLTHGDLNPSNIFSGGVIDLGSAFNAPAGYDLVSNTHHTYFFPKSGDYENLRRSELTKEQLKRYYETLDVVYEEAGLPKLTGFVDDFIFLRSIWATVRMHRDPKLQQYRYEKFRELVRQYLAGEPITCL